MLESPVLGIQYKNFSWKIFRGRRRRHRPVSLQNNFTTNVYALMNGSRNQQITDLTKETENPSEKIYWSYITPLFAKNNIL